MNLVNTLVMPLAVLTNQMWGEEFDQQEPPISDNSKKLSHPSQDSHCLPEPLEGHNSNPCIIRHPHTLDNSYCDKNVYSSIEKSQDVNSSVNNTTC